jgi:hypothetical protein
MKGFRIVAALERASGDVVGFAYGYENKPDQWWHVEVASALPRQIAEEWLCDSFRLVEMAVATGMQGRGVGGLLHDRLLEELPWPRAVLSTMAAETRAYRLYHQRGWVILLDDHFFPGVGRPYRVMGLDLRRNREPS